MSLARTLLAAALVVAVPLREAAVAQHPLRHPMDAVEARFSAAQPVIGYTLRVDLADTTGFTMEMRVRNLPDTFRVAMAAHPEYDDQFWRFMTPVQVEGARGPGGSVTKLDSALWRVVAPGGIAVLRWRVGVPFEPRPRASWRPFLSPNGGLVGGPHSFLYVVGAELAPAQVQLELPKGWAAATGLTPSADASRFYAPSAGVLVDAPILVGKLDAWSFAVDDVPHRVVYWNAPKATAFNMSNYVAQVASIAGEAVELFGRTPYREYSFLVQDQAYGGLEHYNSVTLGAPSATLASPAIAEHLGELAHEYLHTWNLMRIRPVERTGALSHRQIGQTRGLWFSEGLTMFYADLLSRRAGVPVQDSTRVQHVERLLSRYLSSAGNTTISPERTSLAEYGGVPGQLGDYAPSIHTQGEVLGTMLDLMIRDATDDARSMDDVMRLAMTRFAGETGYDSQSMERAIAEVCRCGAREFFERHIRGSTAIDLDRYLKLAGYRIRQTRVPALGRDNQPAPDLRIFAFQPTPADPIRLLLQDPQSSWGRAGLHTNDQVLSINGAPVENARGVRNAVARLRIGDTATVEVRRAGKTVRAVVPMVAYERIDVKLEEVTFMTAKQRARRTAWLASACAAGSTCRQGGR